MKVSGAIEPFSSFSNIFRSENLSQYLMTFIPLLGSIMTSIFKLINWTFYFFHFLILIIIYTESLHRNQFNQLYTKMEYKSAQFMQGSDKSYPSSSDIKTLKILNLCWDFFWGKCLHKTFIPLLGSIMISIFKLINWTYYFFYF